MVEPIYEKGSDYHVVEVQVGADCREREAILAEPVEVGTGSASDAGQYVFSLQIVYLLLLGY